jgi:hypothetical protein
MGKKAFIVTIIIFALSISLAGMQAVNVVKANPIPPQEPISFPYGLTVYSPVNSTYYSNPIQCNVTFACYFGVGCSLNYSIDGAFQDGLPTGNPDITEFSNKYVLSSSFDLPQLSDGTHQISFGIEVKQTLYSGLTTLPSDIPFQPTSPNSSSYVASWVDTVYFTLNQHPAWATPELPTSSPSPSPNLSPTLSILSPKNDSVFNVSMGEGVSFPLTYETNTMLSWVGYSINGANNVTSTGNSIYVRDFDPSRYHTLTLYANDTSGNWAIPQRVTYLVYVYLSDYTPTPPPSPSESPTQQPIISPNATNGPAPIPISPFISLIVFFFIVLAVITGVLVYFEKRRR